MKPVNFLEANTILIGEKGVKDLDVFRGDGIIISKWRLNILDIIKIVFTKTIWFSMITGRTHPPILLRTDRPFERGEEK